jgi:hypothetical protein
VVRQQSASTYLKKLQVLMELLKIVCLTKMQSKGKALNLVLSPGTQGIFFSSTG